MDEARSSSRSFFPRSPQYAVLSTACVTSLYWLVCVNREVPSVYLDEFFHARQALTYIRGDWHSWDSKITTPPGLYVISWLQLLPLELMGMGFKVNVQWLRSINVLGALALGYMLPDIVDRATTSVPSNSKTRTNRVNSSSVHTAANIILFPPLFFFTALYYTDVLSVVSVLVTLRFQQKGKSIHITMAAVTALCFRQTNIFWVGLYLGSLQVQEILSQYKMRPEVKSQRGVYELFRESWLLSSVYDPPVSRADISDYPKVAVSFTLASLSRLFSIVPAFLPYLTTMTLFLSFVLWNGGVVLGDKSNHIATIHLAQILYLWPYIAFFSFPILLSRLLSALGLVQLYHARADGLITTAVRKHYLWIAVFTALAATTIYSNTIIHPFTLADNRHYTFYIFKLLRKYHFLRYAIIPVYILCAYSCTVAAFSRGVPMPIAERTSPKLSRFEPTTSTKPDSHEEASTGELCPSASWLMIWLTVTSLSLATAPLVEPRYFIVPWIMWRMHVPMRHSGAALELWCETIWLLVINAVTGYMFLHRGFTWDQEPNATQRFMW